MAAKEKESDTSAQKLAAEKKKLKVLKNALKEERATREQVEKDLKTAMDKIEQQKQQLSDKVIPYSSLINWVGWEVHAAL